MGGGPGFAGRFGPAMIIRARQQLWILGALLALGAAARVFFAACYRHSPNADYGIAALMVKHIVEGREWPVFYYGQAYMGSLEPLASALLCRLCGLSAFNICLGTALLGVLLLPVIYAWGRDAGGRAAGLAALALTLIGPVGYLRFLALPWGGYGMLLLLGALVLWLGARIAVREFRREDVPAGWYALLGLLAGAGWWTHPLVSAAPATVALVLAVALRLRMFASWRVPAGLAGFLAGSLPWWLWNVRHGWESLGLLGGLGRTSTGEGAGLLLTSRLPDLLDLTALPGPARAAGLIAFGGLVLVAGWDALDRLRRRELPAAVSLGMALLFIAVSLALYCHSHFATYETSRYLLPLVPALAVLAGSAAARLASRVRWGLGWAPLFLVIGFQAWNARYTPAMLRDRTWEFTSEVLTRELAGAGIGAIYCRYPDHWLNAATGEALCFVDIIGERYRPYAWRGELARNVAFLGNLGDIAGFVAGAGGSVRRDDLMQFQFFHDFRAPAPCGRIGPSEWAAAVDWQGRRLLAEISDGNARTAWSAPVLPTEAPWIEIALTRPARVEGVRFISPNGEYPPAWSVDGLFEDGAGIPAWRTLAPCMRINGFFWSGPRVYWDGTAFRAECRFPPAQVSRLRLRFEAPEREGEVYVAELAILGGPPPAAMVSESEALGALLAELDARGIRRLYSDRWVANEVAAATGGGVAVLREPAIFGQFPGTPPRERERKLAPLRPEPGAAILVRVEEAPASRANLARYGIVSRETAVGPWILFEFPPVREGKEGPDLVWTGFSVLAAAP